MTVGPIEPLEPLEPLEEVHEGLVAVTELLDRHGVWYALGFGTLLGAVRDGDLIPWDHDFDLFARPRDRQLIVELSEELEPLGYAIKYAVLRADENLAIAPDDLVSFNAAALVVLKDDKPIGDIYTPWLFEDGILRHFDFEREVWWCPRNSFPAWFVEDLDPRRDVARVRGREYPTLRYAEQWLAHVYGDDFRVPWRCTQKGGPQREGYTAVGDRAAPDLGELVAWCERQGWDRAEYAGLPAWPRSVRGLGPPADLEQHGSIEALVRTY